MRAPAPTITQEVLFLDPEDDLGSIRAKLESVSADEIYLVIPRRCPVLRAPLEFRILARLANDMASETIIVTSDGGRRALARHEGLRTRKSINSVRGLSKHATAIGGALSSVPEWLPIPTVSTLLVLGLLVGLLGLIALVVLPVMKVTVSPTTQTVNRVIEIAVDPTFRAADVQKGQLPGTLMQRRLEVTGAAPTSNNRQGGRDRARGEVVFTNRNSREIIVPRTAIVIARNGSRYSVDSDVRLPPFSVSVARGAITAVNPGVAGNVDVGNITQIEGNFEGVSITNQRATTGGTDRDVRTVSQDDISKLREQLVKRAQDQLMQEFTAQAGPDKSVPPHTLKVRVENEVYEPPLDAEGDQVTAKLMVAATVTSFANLDLNRLAQQMMLSSAPAGYDLPMDQMRLNPPEVTEAVDQRMQLRISGSALLTRGIDVNALEQSLRGKSPTEAASILQSSPDLSGATSQVELTPAWAPRAFRVDVALSPLK